MKKEPKMWACYFRSLDGAEWVRFSEWFLQKEYADSFATLLGQTYRYLKIKVCKRRDD